MKHRLLLLLLTLLAATLPATAYDFIVNEIQYSFTSDGKAVTVSGGGVYQNLGNISIYGVDIPDEVTYSNKTYPVIAIDAEAFKGKYLSSLSFGNNVTEIGYEAFSGCRLRGMLEDKNTDYLNLNKIKTIGMSAFSNFKGSYRHYYSGFGWSDVECEIVSVEFSNIEYIGDQAFLGILVKSVEFNKGTNLKYLGNKAFNGSTINTIILSDETKIEYIGQNVFDGSPWYDSFTGGAIYLGKYFYEYKGAMPNNTDFVLEDGTLGIASVAFKNKTQLRSITIPNSVEFIGSNAFCNCTGLTSLPLPNSVKTICSNAFYGCTGLSSINIGKSVESLGDGAFIGCTGLTSITVNENNLYYDSRNNCNAIIYKFFNKLIQGCSKSTIPSTVEAIGNLAFSGCTGLTSITIPNSVTSIGGSAFSGCTGLTSITIPNSVTSIGASAFAGCTGLTSLTIPSKVTTLGTNAFSGCTGVTTLNYRAAALDNPQNLAGLSNVNVVNFDGGATVVPANLLPNFSKLAMVNVGKDVTTIQNGAFNNCNALKTLSYDAANCASGELSIASLDTLTIGSNVKSLASRAFYNCTNLKKIVSKATTPPTLGDDVFPANTYIGVPASAGSTYKNKWAKIANASYTRVLPMPIYRFDTQANFLGNGNPYVTTEAISESKTSCSETGFIIVDDSNNNNKRKVKSSRTTNDDNEVYFNNTELSKYVLPGHTYRIYPYIVAGGVEYDGYYHAELEIPALQSSYNYNVGPSSIILTDNTVIPENINFTNATFTLDNKTYESYGNDIIVTGLRPNNWYSGNYSVTVSEGAINSTNVGFSTPSLSMKTQPVKMLTNSVAMFQAYTNLSEEETSCGFLWKRYDAPDEMLGNPVYCPVYDGMMMGSLKNMPEGVYYKYRPFYRANDGSQYYGDWVAFYTGDATVEFEPVAHTYNNARVSGDNAIIQGIAIRGSKDITEQGFEYWTNGPAQSEALMAPSSVNKVAATGERMSSTLENLKSGTNYSFRAYVKTASGTTYGEVRSFKTPKASASGDVNGDGKVDVEDVNAIINIILELKTQSDYPGNADLNGDNKVDVEDVNAVINIILGL